ncbi:helix-turn-helix domain-containing protein [Tateyamaria sp. SN6-1]|uniref:helix-turn-helix domain-containing protein n=1 Tax=Tateyamaria sp. SN6-1 TaxID=3092148 RepID=UPI0039F497A3
MLQTHPPTASSLGADLRALRKSRGLTLQDMADALGRSVGWVSQVERDMSEPSITDLRHMAATLDIAVSTLFRNGVSPANEEGYIVRKGARRPIGSRAAGLVEELLSPDLTDDFEVVHSTFEPHSRIKDPVTRPTQEVGYILSGQLDLEIGDTVFSVGPGDSFRIRGEPFRWMNPYPTPAVAIWVIAPPVY